MKEFKQSKFRIGGHYALMAMLVASVVLSTLGMSTQSAYALTAITTTDKGTITDHNALNELSGVIHSTSSNTYIVTGTGSGYNIYNYDHGTATLTSDTSNPAGVLGDETMSSATASSTRTDTFMLQSLGGTDQLLRTASTTFFAESVASASSQLTGQTVNSVTLWLKKTGTATGTATIAVFDSVCTTVYSFGTQDVSLLTTSYQPFTYTGAAAGRTLASGDRIGVFFNAGSAGNELSVEYSAADRFDGTTNTITHTATGVQGTCTPTSQTARELHIQLSFIHSASLVNDNLNTANWENVGTSNIATQTNDGSTAVLSGGARSSSTANQPLVAEKKTTSSVIAGQEVNSIELRLSKTGTPTGTITVGEFANDGAQANKLNQVTGTSANCVVVSTTSLACAEKITATGALVGETINSLTISMQKGTSPTVTISACVMDSSLTCLYSFGSISAASIASGTYTQYTFTNYDASYVIPNSVVYIGVKGSALETGSNQVLAASSTADVYDSTNSIRARHDGVSWLDVTTSDMGSSTANQAFRLDLLTLPTLLNTFGTMDASTLTTSLVDYTFTTTSDFTLSSGATTYVGVLYTANSVVGNFVNVATIATDSFDGTTNSIFTAFQTSAISDTSTTDFRFILYDTDVETNANIYASLGSAQDVYSIELDFQDTSKIPPSIEITVSTDTTFDETPTTCTLTIATGVQTCLLNDWENGQYIELLVPTWGSAKSIAIAEYDINGITTACTSHSTVSNIDEDGTFFLACIVTSDVSIARMKINVDGTIEDSVSSGSSVRSITGIESTKNKVWLVGKVEASTSDDIAFGNFNRDLTSYSEDTTGSGDCSDVNDFGDVAVMEGATAADDRAYALIATDSSTVEVCTDETDTVVTNLATSFGAGTAVTGDQLTMLNGKLLANMKSLGFWEITTPGNVFTQVRTATNNIFVGQSFNQTISGRTYYSTCSVYISDVDGDAECYIPNTGVTSEDFALIESLDALAHTMTVESSAKYYRIDDIAILTATTVGATSWTLEALPSLVGIDTDPYQESLGVPLALNEAIADDNVIIIQCTSGTYAFPATPNIQVVDDSDCLQFLILDINTNVIGRELPYATEKDVVWADDYTYYNIHVTTLTDSASNYHVKIIYDGKDVDLNYFDAASNVQIRLLYGQCYTMQFVRTLSSEVVESNLICADDVVFKESVLGSELGFPFWTLPWGGTHSYNSTSHVLNTVIRHADIPYNYTRQIELYNGTIIYSDDFESADEIDAKNKTIDSPYFNFPMKVKLIDENGIMRYNAWFNSSPLDQFSDIATAFGGIEFEGWALFLFLPIIFAAMFTRSVAGIGGALVVAFIGVLFFMNLIPWPTAEGDITKPVVFALIGFVAVIGLLVYRNQTQY
jgi:hypothetical protein